MVPRITTLIRSSKIAVERKRRKARLKMRSNGLETHRPVKILHSAANFTAYAARISTTAATTRRAKGSYHGKHGPTVFLSFPITGANVWPASRQSPTIQETRHKGIISQKALTSWVAVCSLIDPTLISEMAP